LINIVFENVLMALLLLRVRNIFGLFVNESRDEKGKDLGLIIGQETV